ncbi:MAG: hypothetical protein JW742_07290, partial [Candidatus Aminicenantes bacterium]|nr:hypothetical protein [Candidatus Aminicenantes bacterium]
FGIFHGSFRSPYFALLSLKVNLQQVAAALFRVKPPFPSVPWAFSLAVLLAVCAAAALVLHKRVKSVEVIK